MKRQRHPGLRGLSARPPGLPFRRFLLGLALALPTHLPAAENAGGMMMNRPGMNPDHGSTNASSKPPSQGMPSMNMSDMDMADMPEGHAAAGKMLAETQCAGCHGARGLNDSPDYPLLAGQDAMYLAGALGAYRSGARRSDAMMAVAMRLSDQDIANLAAYFASCPFQR
jgi:cytochrome c553